MTADEITRLWDAHLRTAFATASEMTSSAFSSPSFSDFSSVANFCMTT